MTKALYTDTRGLTGRLATFTEVVVKGMADGGGLFAPESLPTLSIDEIVGWADIPYAQRAARLYRAFDVDLGDDVVEELMRQAYGAQFDDADICPIVSLDSRTHMLELWHGPTSAFKDMALQCLPRFFVASARQLKASGAIDNDFCILVATSGDTGKAALEGFRDLPGVAIGVLYPHGGVSDIQYKQMATQLGGNVHVWGVDGNFDDCQTAVKTVFADASFARSLAANHATALSSANSINWGRLMPQIVYYVSSYAQLVRRGVVAAGDPIDVCVPTGNFGNILAAWYAKRIGTPIGRLLCASNENCVLADFINTGVYDISDRPFVLTPSPSMDILVSSNLERQLFELTGHDTARIVRWMDDLKRDRAFRIDEETFGRLREDFAAASVDSAECLATIREVHERYGYLVDPHTAVAFRVVEQLRGDNPVLIASTAHWAKFGANVYRGLHGIPAGEPLPQEVAALSGCKLNDVIAQETGACPIPAGLARLDDAEIRFNEVLPNNISAIESAVQDFLSCLR